jgi:hypothetical protein
MTSGGFCRGLLLGLVGCATWTTIAAQPKEDLFSQVFGKKAQTERNLEAELALDGYGRDPVPITITGQQLSTPASLV